MGRRLEIRNKRQKPIEKQITDIGDSVLELQVPKLEANELQPRNFDVVALQKLCLEDGLTRSANRFFFLSGGMDKKLGTGFIVRGKMQDHVFGFTAISERMGKLRIRGRFFNYSIIHVHSPHE